MGPAGHQARAGRLGVLHRRQRPERGVGPRRGRDEGVREIPTGTGAHGLYLSRDATQALRHEPARGQRQRARRLHRGGADQVADPRRRQPGHGQRHRGRRQLWLSGPLRPRGLRAVHRRRAPDPADRRRATARTACACGPNRAATPSATPASPAEHSPGLGADRPAPRPAIRAAARGRAADPSCPSHRWFIGERAGWQHDWQAKSCCRGPEPGRVAVGGPDLRHGRGRVRKRAAAVPGRVTGPGGPHGVGNRTAFRAVCDGRR